MMASGGVEELELARTPAQLSPATFARFARFAHAELGIKMPESKLTMMQGRLLRRVRALGLESVDQYAERLFAPSNAEEREHFINAITTNKTDFFREPEHFAFLVEVVLPAISRAEARGGRRFKAWSAGCSSGEEPYSLAMTLAECSGEHFSDFEILATDISTRVLNLAQTAIYQESQIAPVPPAFRKKYLLRSLNRDERLVRIVPGLREKVAFRQLNLVEPRYPINGTFDVVFFRNVMIYFDRPTQEQVLNKICRHLAPGGYLFAGHSESLAGLDVPLKPVRASIYRKAESGRRPGGMA